MAFPNRGSRHSAALAAPVVILAAAASFVIPASSEANTEPPAVAEFHKSISPMLEDHCYECHGDGYDKGKVAFDSLESNEQILDKSLWYRVLVNTRAGLMPAERKPRLSTSEQKKLEHWIKYEVFGIDPKNPDPGRVTVRRLNRIEYRNTIHDLMGVDFKSEEEFPADDTGYGFDNIGDVLTVSPILLEKYVAAAQSIVKDGVPVQPRSPAQQIVQGTSFTGVDISKGRMRLKFTEPATIAAKFKSNTPGTYRVVLSVDMRGDFVFNPGRVRGIVKIDGKDVLNQEFGYYNEKSLTFESRHEWPVAEHEMTIELQPLVES